MRTVEDMWRRNKKEEAGGVGILQLLKPNQSRLVPVLGKRTGWDKSYSKKEECARELGVDMGWVSIVGRCVKCFLNALVRRLF